MNPTLLAALAVFAAYLIGAIPFGYVIFYAARGIDIRTVGSGNIGATNVGRQLGFRYFLLVFFLDMGKGYLPTWSLPLIVAHLGGTAPPDTAVLVGLAAILGHNFPIYLKFRGGKGVATSFGVLLALDPVASVATVAGFITFLLITRYVSVSSVMSGLVFMLIHFLREPEPWARAHLAMSLLTFALVALMAVRHRKNFARIIAGTEPKVSFRKKRPRSEAEARDTAEPNRERSGDEPQGEPSEHTAKPPASLEKESIGDDQDKDETMKKPPSGRISWTLLAAVVMVTLAVSLLLANRAHRRSELIIGDDRFTEVASAATGHQRADRVTFANAGRLLAVTCPRYDRLVLYRVSDAETLECAHDIALSGRPMGVWATADRLFILERPPGESRHLEPGWWETFDFDGKPVGSRHLVGFYPDDMAMSSDGRLAYVLTSGRAEGDDDRPAPALCIVATDTSTPKTLARLTFDQPGDDPMRITLSRSGRRAVITLAGSNQAASVDLTDPSNPRLLERSSIANAEVPYPTDASGDVLLMPVASRSEAVWLTRPFGKDLGLSECVAATLPHGSGLRIDHADTKQELGRLIIRGSMNIGRTKPTGLAYSAERGLLAVANRSGGVHLVSVRPNVDRTAEPPPLVASQNQER